MMPNPPCGGIITIPGARPATPEVIARYGPPPCCEVHLLAWGHPRSDLGVLRGIVEPDPA
jgi:hypothetical protein